MNSQATRSGDWLAGLAAACNRLVHPALIGDERGRRGRLLGVLLAAPFVIAAALVQSLAPASGIAGMLAGLCGVFGISWLGAFYIAARPSGRGVEIATLVSASSLFAAMIAMTGGLSSPVAVLLAALPFEAWWVTRSKRAMGVGALFAAAVAISVGLIVNVGGSVAGSWLWLAPLVHAGTFALRLLAPTDVERDIQAGGTVALPETCFDAVVVTLAGGAEVEHISAQARGLFGIEPAMLLGSGLFDRIHVADRVAFLCAAARTRDEGVPSRCDLRFRMPATADGQASTFAPFEAEFVRPSDDTQAVVVLIRDGREKNALQAEVAEAVNKVGASDVAQGRFLATVSHELRTPLNAIIGFSELLLHTDISGELAPRQAEHVTLIREAGNHLLSVVNAILDVSKIEAGSYQITMEPFELRPAVDLCCAMLQPQADEKGVKLSAKLPACLDEVLGDQRAVHQILINLLSNAVKFTPEGGSVSVTAARNDGMIRISVNDTGIGIGPEDLNRIGRPFTQVQNDYTRQFQGTGLGLSLVKGLVKLHGGTMSMESAPGLGTTVTIGLPSAKTERYTDNTGETGEGHGSTLRKIA